MQYRRPAFTLIELLVVIAIIGILSALVVTQLGASQIKARNATAQSDIAEMGKAVDSFRTDDVASGTVVSNPPSGTVDTLSGTSGTLTSLFTGTQNVQGLTYAALVQKTPSSAYTYRYYASGTASSVRQLVQGASGQPEYALCSTLVNAFSPAACVQDGSGAQAGTDQVTAASGQGLLSPAGSSGLVAWYQLEGSGSQASAADASSNGNTGALNNFSFDGTTNGWVDGKFGKGLLFNGSSDYINIPSLTLGSSGTLSTWVYLNAAVNYPMFISFSYPVELRMYSNTLRPELNFNNGGPIRSPNSISLNNWHLITGTFTGTTASLYVDGSLVNTGGINVQSSITGASLGDRYSANAYYMLGKLDDVRIYNRALSANEVQQLYQGTL